MVPYRAATAAKATKAVALPRFWDQLTLSQPGGADYTHHSTMGLVWLKFAVAALHCILRAITLDF